MYFLIWNGVGLLIFGVFLTVNVVSLWRHVLRSSCALCFQTKNNFLRVVSIWSSRSSQSSKKLFRRSGRSYGNATQTIASDPDNWDDLYRLDRIEFYPDDRDDRVNFEAIIWKRFPYDRPDRPDRPSRLKNCLDDRDDHMETLPRRSQATRTTETTPIAWIELSSIWTIV